ncbi:ISPsy3, transposase, internal deletion (plasmid) [Pseudomonas syringae pv. tomato str. DC3000]|uniref:ISPsy3, transposase, internal deletion n=1 Tax=Pseudomonas syringae pv. tomato (strain ATCC BAA-871 / DC3000) TaxID=223283 RepID=Q88BW2_PSESM|nr:ISPsy3, transposase, internal deletion [Pseudomonas syringae pv. tomato str. DC3000]
MKPAYPPLLLQMSPAYKPRPLKNLFTANQCWAHLLEEGGWRDIEVESSCVLCGPRMVYTRAVACLTVQGLVNNAQSIAQLRYVRD